MKKLYALCLFTLALVILDLLVIRPLNVHAAATSKIVIKEIPRDGEIPMPSNFSYLGFSCATSGKTGLPICTVAFSQ